jgi:hypothetical protein
MSRQLNDNEFEQFLQDETKRHRMYPSDQIWRNIQLELHGTKAWPALTIISVMVVLALTISTLINTNSDHLSSSGKQNFAVNITGHEEVAAPVPITSTEREVLYDEHLSPDKGAAKTFAALKEKEDIADQVAAYQVLAVSIHPVDVPSQLSSDNSINKMVAALNKASAYNGNDNDVQNNLHTKSSNTSSDDLQKIVTPSSVATSKASAKEKEIKAEQEKSISTNAFADDFLKDFAYRQQAVFNAHKKQKRLALNYYVAPSISYRKLADDKERDYYQPSVTSAAATNSNTSINDAVRHKPAMGIEIGAGIMYSLNNKLKIRTGLQFNVRQYHIDAYESAPGMATIAIVNNNKLDSINQYSLLSNNGGYAPEKLDNLMYQLSMPIGIQYDFWQKKKIGLSFGASIQPTLTVFNDLYIISTDYKYYTSGTPFLRKWNINSSAELNFTYNVGSVKWYIGPQIRYQHLPTYSDKYPIKEYRMDYGLKIGISKTF